MRWVFLTVAAVRFFVVPVTVLLPFYVTDHLRAPPEWFGFLVAGFGAGVIAGYLFAGLLKTEGRATSRLIAASLLGLSAFLGALGLVQHRWAALVLLTVAGVGNGLLSVKLVTILQLTTERDLRGRVFGLLRTVGDGLTPVALLLAGVVADLAGQDIASIYLACGVILVGVGLLAASSRPMRTYLESAARQPAADGAAARSTPESPPSGGAASS